MKFGLLTSPHFLRHDTGSHVENAGRLRAIAGELQEIEGLTQFSPRLAEDAELLRLHHPEVLRRVEETAAAGGGWLDGDTFCSPASAEVARYAVGGTLDLVAAVVAGELDRGFALVRPPGHHATPEQSMGFCLYSNVALAARHAVEKCGLKRVFIFDWDVHHGNGTQDCLYHDPHTCFFSFHQSPFYPGSGSLSERGAGNGAGLTYNLPLPAGMGDADYAYAMEQLVKPVVESFDPQLILVSAGYDAHREDPLGGMQVTADGFGGLAARLARWSEGTACAGKLVGVLEGGYNPYRLAQSVRATLEAWKEPAPQFVAVSHQAVRRACLHQVEEARRRWAWADSC